MKKDSLLKIFGSRKFWWFVLACVVSLLFILIAPGVSFYNAFPFQDLWVQVLLLVLIFGVWFWFNFKERLKQHVQGSKIFADDSAQVSLGGIVNRRRGRLLRRDVRRLCQFIRGREVHRSWFLRRNNLYDMPWYLVLGASGSGKTSLVRQQHLNFVAQSYQQDRVQSEVFDYALASEAVLFDVDSELFVQKTLAERYLWLVLLKSLKRARARRPLNGIVVTVSLKDLLGATRESKQKLFENFRLRLHEAQQRLGMEVPIYVVFTQLDYVIGFADFVLQFLELETQAVLGMTFSVQDQDAVGSWALEYDLLLEHLQRRLERDLDAESGVLINSRKTYFLVQMAALKPLLAEFAKEVFLTRGLLCQNYLRGVYFVAHQIQVDQSFDLIRSERSLSMVELPRFLKDKNFFVANIVSEVLLPERELVGVHPVFSKSFGLLRQVRFLLIVGLSLSVLLAWIISANQYLAYDRQLLWQLNQAETTKLNTQDQSFNALYQALDRLVSLRDAGDSTWLHLGLWVHHSGVDAVDALYDQALLQKFLPYVVGSLVQNLQMAVRENPNDMVSVEDLYYGLSSYLMLQNLEHLDAVQMMQVLNGYWAKSFANDLPVQAWLSLRLQDLLSLSLPAQTLNAGLVEQARALLWNSPVYMQAYLRLKLMTLQSDAKTQNVSGDLNADANEVFVNLSHASVPQLFTHEGYENIYKVQADHYLQDTASESWVFGQQYQTHYSSNDLDRFRVQMDELYWKDYLNAWNNALAQVNFASFSDVQAELDVLSLLSSKDSPLTMLLKNIDKNTDFDYASDHLGARLFGQNKLANAAANFSNVGNVVSNQFAPLNSLLGGASAASPLANVNVALNNLQQYLSGLQNSSNSGLSAYNAAVQIYQGQADRSITALASLASQMPQPMARWLNQMVANTYAVIFARANVYLSSQWQAEVASFYQQALAGRYPFVATNNDATVQDFTNFFKPGGIEDSFVKKYLVPFISTDNFGHVIWQSVDNIPFSENMALTDEMTVASQIRSTFFGGSNAMLNFTLTPVSLTNLHHFTLIYDGKTLSDDGRGVGIGFVWPPMNTDGSVSVIFGRLLETDQTQNYSGPWGLFRLLEHSNLVKAHGASSYSVSFVDEDMSANFILSASSVSNPFDVRLIRTYRCPDGF